MLLEEADSERIESIRLQWRGVDLTERQLCLGNFSAWRRRTRGAKVERIVILIREKTGQAEAIVTVFAKR